VYGPTAPCGRIDTVGRAVGADGGHADCEPCPVGAISRSDPDVAMGRRAGIRTKPSQPCAAGTAPGRRGPALRNVCTLRSGPGSASLLSAEPPRESVAKVEEQGLPCPTFAHIADYELL
jgi:hypothetical protein